MSYKNTTIKDCFELQFIICGAQKVNCTKYNCCNFIKKYSVFIVKRSSFSWIVSQIVLLFYFTPFSFKFPLLQNLIPCLTMFSRTHTLLVTHTPPQCDEGDMCWCGLMAGSGRSVLNMIFGPGSGPAPLVRRKSPVARNNSRPPINLWYVYRDISENSQDLQLKPPSAHCFMI